MARRKARADRYPLPKHPLPLELFVKNYLIDKKARAGLRSDFPGDDDPYQSAREGLALALIRAQMAEDAEEAIRRDDKRLDEVEREAAELGKKVRQFALARDLLGVLAPLHTRGTARLDYRARNETVDRVDRERATLLAAARAFDNIATEASQARERAPRKKPKSENARAAAFVEQLVFCWFGLTGKVPGPAEKPFEKFVVAGYNTLCTRPVETLKVKFYVGPYEQDKTASFFEKPSWAGQIRKALTRLAERPDWDRADRYEKDLWPPGTEFEIRDPIRRVDDRAPRRETRSEIELSRMIEDMAGGGDKALSAALFLLEEFRAGKTSRERLIGLGFDPTVAVAILASSRS